MSSLLILHFKISLCCLSDHLDTKVEEGKYICGPFILGSYLSPLESQCCAPELLTLHLPVLNTVGLAMSTAASFTDGYPNILRLLLNGRA